jgi:ribonuclease/clavin/mitogillin
MQEQVAAVPAMTKWGRTMPGYTEIDTRDNLVIACADGRALLASLGITGELVHTPGHSDDSVSLLLDTGEAFTGDLTDPRLIGPEDPDVVMASWCTLRDRGAKTVYAGHGPVRPMPDIQTNNITEVREKERRDQSIVNEAVRESTNNS